MSAKTAFLPLFVRKLVKNLVLTDQLKLASFQVVVTWMILASIEVTVAPRRSIAPVFATWISSMGIFISEEASAMASLRVILAKRGVLARETSITGVPTDLWIDGSA